MIRLILISLLFILSNYVKAQDRYKVLFLGNSYTSVNNLPQMIHDVALSAGDTLDFDSYTPGGYKLSEHNTDSISLSKIMVGDWDYVVLQEQSQTPVINANSFKGGAIDLNRKISQYALCSVPMLYMTWGRKNGDAVLCPNVPEACTYESMDTVIRLEYLKVADDINSELSPVSMVWYELRKNYPGINLYQVDESHPSVEGSYAAACCFYACLFKKDPTLITFDNGLNPLDAGIIRNIVKTVVFDSLILFDFKQLPYYDNLFYSINSPNTADFFPNVNTTSYAESCFWDFGDGDTLDTIALGTTHNFADGTYLVSVTAKTCDLQGLHTVIADTIIQFCNHTPTVLTPNPWVCYSDSFWTQLADSYQWFCHGVPLPDTTQFLSIPSQCQNNPIFSVMSTVNGCSELSIPFASMFVQNLDYYINVTHGFDPCLGDTGIFALLHNSGFSGTEVIQWYKNDTLLIPMTNEDTLLITEPGIYTVKVVDSNFICPLDTTTFTYQFNCGAVGVYDEIRQNEMWEVFPNPASESITIKLINLAKKEQIQIYNLMGKLVKIIEVSETTKVNISDLSNGIYFIRSKDNKLPTLKFIKTTGI